jgi:phage RecT family recombinase
MAQTQTLARPQQQQAPAPQPAPRQNLAEVFYADLDAYTPNLRDALPANIPVERFKRVLVTAVSQTPELLYADRRSLFNAAMRCAVDGLIPDGREAALVVFHTDVKRRNPQTGIDHVSKVEMVQYMPMVQGLRKRMYQSGEVASAEAEAVFEKDHFRYARGDHPFIEHEPPALGMPRGQVIGAYAIIRLKSGEVIRDVMDRPMIEAARNVSRAKNSPMWANFYWEGAKKTVLRRASKQAPFSSELRQVFERDEEAPEIGPDLGPGLSRQPEPHREQYQITRVEPTGPEFAVVDLDGVENIYSSAGGAAEALRICLDEAARLGPDRLEGWWESNQGAIEFLAAAGYGDVSVELTRAYDAASHPKPADRPIPSGQQGAPDPAAQPAPARVEPDRGASPAPRRTRQTQRSEEPATEVPDEEQAPHAPPEHRSSTAVAPQQPAPPAGDSDPFGLPPMPPTEEPAMDESPAARPELEIVVPMKSGKRDYRTWALALLGPKVRRCGSSNELAELLGANEQILEQARAPGSMTAADREEMERIIAEQWQRLPA